MQPAFRLALAVTIVAASSSLRVFAASSDTQQEYEQVRKIALKDPKVRAAFDHANDKLNERILEIDPSLRPIVEQKTSGQPAQRQVAQHEAPSLVPFHSHTHVVTKGETLTSIAIKYKINVARLKAANNLSGNEKLRVGQRLTIPSPQKTTASSSHEGESWWTKVKNSF